MQKDICRTTEKFGNISISGKSWIHCSVRNHCGLCGVRLSSESCQKSEEAFVAVHTFMRGQATLQTLPLEFKLL